MDFPLQQLASFPRATRVLDPFCGRGTTLYAARLTGLPATGIDINPVAVAIAQAKLVQVTPGAVTRLATQILERGAEVELPEGEFWEWCFERDTLREVVALEGPPPNRTASAPPGVPPA